MNIIGKITGIKYKVLLSEDLKEVAIKDFDINKIPSSCLVTNNKNTYLIIIFKINQWKKI